MRAMFPGVTALIAFALFGVSTGCSSGGPGGPPADMSGYWKVYLTPMGAPNEVGPLAVRITQSGSTLDGAGQSGTVTGNNFTMSSFGGSFSTVFVGTVLGNNAVGTATFTGSLSGTAAFRLERFTPAGSMTATGMLQGVMVNGTSMMAVGGRDYDDVARTMLDEVEVMMMENDTHLELDFDATNLALGTLAVPGTVAATVLCRDDTLVFELTATGGSITVTQYDSSGFAGTFSLTFPGGDMLSGSFDVSYDLEAYDP